MARSKHILMYLAAAALLPLPFFPIHGATMVWTNIAGGAWSGAGNWNPNVVPGSTDTAVIATNVGFTVTIGATVTVSNLFLGTASSVNTNRLDVNFALTVLNEARVENNAWFRQSAPVNVSNTFHNAGFFQWLDSPLRGNGVFVNETNGFVQTRAAGVSTLGVRNFDNYGRFQVGGDDAGVQFSSNVTFTNHLGGNVELDLPSFGLRDASGATGTLVVNRGTIRATASVNFGPSYLTVDLLNYGTLSLETATWYLGAGTNYGAIITTSGARKLSTVSTEPFVFAAGTTFSTPAPQLYAGGEFVFEAPVDLNSSLLYVGDASDGANTATPSVTFNADINFSGELVIGAGQALLTNATANIFLREVTLQNDSTVGNPNAYLTNAANLTVDIYNQSFNVTDNAGTITVRTNLNFTAGTIRGAGGVIILGTNSSSTISGGSAKTFSGQHIVNYGLMLSSEAAAFSSNASWENRPGATLNFAAGSFSSGPGSVVNDGTIQGYGAIGGSIVTTNLGLIVADDSLNRVLTIASLTQLAGETRLRRGILAGLVDIRGGSLNGTNQITGSLRNAAAFDAGTPLGLLTITGNYTNTATGVEQMQIRANATVPGRDYTQVRVSGTAVLAGTLNVSFAAGFFPTIGSSYTAMTWAARSGMFDQILTPNYEFEVSYLPNALVLRASNALPNVIVSAPATQLVCVPFFLNASASDLDGAITNIDLLFGSNVIGSFPASSVRVRVLHDFPGPLTFSARATDDRGAVKTISTNVIYVTMPLHVINLGGFFETNTAFKLCMLGETGSNYVVEAAEMFSSPTVTNWHDIGAMEFTNGIFRYSDTDATNFQMRYYRARQSGP